MSILFAALSLTFQDPAPPLPKVTPGQIVEAAPDEAWRDVDPELLLLVDLEGGRRVVIELNPTFAPEHVANIQSFARNAHWSGASVYRVQDNYVAQWGVGDEERRLPAGVSERPAAEYVRPVSDLKVTGLGSSDSYASAAGFVDGWPVALYRDGTASLTHCYGTVGVGRGLDPETGSGSELYAVIGHAPRHLDRNIAIVGRVIDGIEYLSSLPRGSEGLGMYAENETPVPITRSVLAAMLQEEPIPRYQVMREDSEAFARYLSVRANRNDDFYRVAAGGVDVCNVNVPVRRVDG
ncbi:peptidylprolyl isomerase [Sphingomicrobium sp. XHP0239]|uniref:peptidylprolyl isomerase n=1 Tax=Sphingomicrobium maritimum TaxID=3133972 RepID=UPI0031CCCB60